MICPSRIRSNIFATLFDHRFGHEREFRAGPQMPDPSTKVIRRPLSAAVRLYDQTTGHICTNRALGHANRLEVYQFHELSGGELFVPPRPGFLDGKEIG